MRNTHTMLLGLVLGATAIGCNSGSSVGPELGTSKARIVATTTKGSDPATLHVTGTDEVTSDVTVDQTLTVSAGKPSMIDLTLPSSTYTFTVSVLGGASGDVTLASSTAQGDLKDGETSDIVLTAQGGSSPAVNIGVAAVPEIGAVDVKLTGSGAGAMAQIHVDASDPGGDALTFFWSGAGLDAAVPGSATMSIPAAALMIAATPPVLHVVVQGAAGASASTNITLAFAGTTVKATTSVSSGDGVAAQACLSAQAECDTTCLPTLSLGGNVTVDTQCAAACSLSLASCMAK